jgi:hypothetical protein
VSRTSWSTLSGRLRDGVGGADSYDLYIGQCCCIHRVQATHDRPVVVLDGLIQLGPSDQVRVRLRSSSRCIAGRDRISAPRPSSARTLRANRPTIASATLDTDDKHLQVRAGSQLLRVDVGAGGIVCIEDVRFLKSRFLSTNRPAASMPPPGR